MKIAVEKREPVRLYLEVGLWEGGDMLLPNRTLSAILQGKGYVVTYREYVGAHAPSYWKQTLPGALEQILGKTSVR